MKVEIITDQKLWDNFVDNNPSATIFHKWNILKIFEAYSNSKLLPYGIYYGHDLIGVFPAYFKKLYGLKTIFSPPKNLGLTNLGPLIENIATNGQSDTANYYNSIINALNSEFKRLRPNITDIFSSKNIDVNPFIRLGYQINVFYDYSLDLQQPLESIWNGFDKDCKASIKKCEKMDLSLKQVHDGATFQSLMTVGLAELGETYYNRLGPNYINDLIQAYPDNIKLYFLYRDDVIVGISGNCGYNGTYNMQWGYANSVNNHKNFNEYIMWELIKIGKSEGYKTLFNPDADTERLTYFKSKFNYTLDCRYNIYKSNVVANIAKFAYGAVPNRKYLNKYIKI